MIASRPPGRAAVSPRSKGRPLSAIEGRVSGHSLRVGGAQSLAAGGASLVEMQTAGRCTKARVVSEPPGRHRSCR